MLESGHTRSLDIETGQPVTETTPLKYIHDLPIEIRHGFVKKVLYTVFIQLFVTCVFIFFFQGLARGPLKKGNYLIIQHNETATNSTTNETYTHLVSTKEFHPNELAIIAMVTLFSIATIVSFASICFLSRKPHLARRHPTNIQLLVVFTLAESVVMGIGCIGYDLPTIAIAIGETTLLVLALSVYATVTKTDFTGCGPIILILLCMVLFSSIAFAVFPLPGPYNYLLSICFIMVFSFCLVSDIQKIVGGTHRKFKFEIDDWVFAALNIYLDILNIFLNILSATNSSNSN